MGRVERKHATIKLILSRLSLSYPQNRDGWLVKFAVFLSNVLFGNKVASSFELARGYTPALFGTSKLKVTGDILEFYKDFMEKRALKRILRPKTFTPIEVTLLTSGTNINGYVETKRGLSMRRPYKVLSCDGFEVEIRASRRGPKAMLAVEDVRLQSTNDLAKEIVENELGIEQQPAGSAQLEREAPLFHYPDVGLREYTERDQSLRDSAKSADGSAPQATEDDIGESQSSSAASKAPATSHEYSVEKGGEEHPANLPTTAESSPSIIASVGESALPQQALTPPLEGDTKKQEQLRGAQGQAQQSAPLDSERGRTQHLQRQRWPLAQKGLLKTNKLVSGAAGESASKHRSLIS